MANPLPGAFLNFPIVDPKTGQATVDFVRWLNQLISQIANLNPDGTLNAGMGTQIDPATLAKQIANLDSNGIVMPSGVDFSRSYVNKYLDYINDGTTYAKTLASYVQGGVPYVFKGAWSSSASYKPGDEVTSAGSYYLCLTANSNSQPPNANWQWIGPSTLDVLPDGSTYVRTSSMMSGPNIIDNGNFEADSNLPPAGWQNGAGPPASINAVTLSWDTTTPYAGNQSLVCASSGGNSGVQAVRRFAVVAGETYRFSFASKYVSGTVGAVANIRASSGTNALMNSYISIPSTATSWTTYASTITIPSGATFIVAYFYSNSGPATWEIDSVSLVRVSSLDNEVSDGTAYQRMPTSNMDANRRALIDFGQSGHVGKVLDNINDGTNYARPLAASLYLGNPAYRTSKAAILSLSPTHYWPLDNVSYADLGTSPSNLTPVGTIKASGLSLSPGDHIVGTFTNNDSSSALYASATNTTTWTIMAWTAPGYNFQWATTSGIIGRSNAAPFNAPTNYEAHLFVSSAGFVYAGVYNGSNTIIRSSYAPNWNIPHHLAVTFGSGTLTLYIDGMVAAQAGSLGTENPGTENTWTVGAVYGSSWPSPLVSGWNLNSNGTNLQDVAVWEGTALTPLQIQRIVVSGGGRFASLSSVLDDSGRKARTGAHSTYRPLSNPLTATDAGSNVTVTISAFTMRIGGTDVSISGSTITGLGYKTVYYIYYDDANMAGGAVTFVATTSKETALAGDGRFFVGSILTPPSGGNATIGNSDGGAGAQVGFLERFWPTTATTPGTGYTNAGLAFDQDTTTYAFGTLSAAGSLVETWLNFPQSGRATLATSITLKVISSVTITAGTVTATLRYSTDGGVTSTTIYSVTSSRAKSLDTVTLTLPVVVPSLQVSATIAGSGTTVNASHNIYEIWLEVNS